jgi:acyl-CoA dehydrogenase
VATLLSSLIWFALFFSVLIFLAYQRFDLRSSTIGTGVALAIYTALGTGAALWFLLLWVAFGCMVALNFENFRRTQITAAAFNIYKTMVPELSDTEREALEAGTVGWDGELFTGHPNWNQWLAIPKPKLTDAEQAFLDGPTNQLCKLLDDWQIVHELGDMPPEVWAFIKKHGFFAMIIPVEYGGLGFSANAVAKVLARVVSRSVVAASTIAVPNSLGPAELLVHYGTEEQKQRYLPGLADGTEVPCFALTAPRAGSDAASIPDTGIVCIGEYEGKETLGIRLNWDKRYITLSPVATVIGLAFKLYDPEQLLSEEVDRGITAALIPANTPGVVVGRRHMPLGTPFQNGPTQGKDVFVPVDAIIGGPDKAGQGWRMLMEQLSAGRGISLPAEAQGGAQAAIYATGAYARIRKQFNVSISQFEGVAEVIARMAGNTYIMNSAVSVTCNLIARGEKPSVPSAILKAYCTEIGRTVSNDAMDVQGGKGIMMGPKNYLANTYASIPISITVEGANILTRSLIVFGQGAIRCHPYVLKEMAAAKNPDYSEGLAEFDEYLFKHIGNALGNAARSFVLALTHARHTDVPIEGPTKRYYQHINRYSAAFALAADTAMLVLGGSLKRRESLSGRLADVFAALYLASTVLKHFENQGRQASDLPLVEWACRKLLYQAQEQLHGFLRNFPNRPVAAVLRVMIFPRGRTYFAPADKLGAEIVDLVTHSTPSRERLAGDAYKAQHAGNHLGELQMALEMAEHAAPLEKKIREALKAGLIEGADLPAQIEAALKEGLIIEDEAEQLRHYDKAVMALVAVDDFAPEDFGRG